MATRKDTITPGTGDQLDSQATSLRGVWLILAWVVWCALAVASLISFATSIFEYLGAVKTLCRPGLCVSGQPTEQTAEMLRRLGLSVGTYAAFSIALVVVTGLVYCFVAGLVVWRRPTDWLALLTTSMLITQGLYENNYLQGVFNSPTSPWNLVGLLLGYISPIQVLFVCAFFPNGRSVPRWLGWMLVGLCLLDLPPSLLPSMPLGVVVETLFILSGFPLIAGSMIYRYRRVSTPVERQQTKWVVVGGTLAVAAFLVWFVPQPILYSGLSQPGSLYDLLGHPLFSIATLAIPICIGFAILRYRLWDIDVIINRTLVYGSLTGLLGALYAGLIIGLESLASDLTGNSDRPVILVISTLVIAALILPLRRRIQSAIDRRFYRRKYDAEKMLEAFSVTLRSEIDLQQLSEQLLRLVQEAIEPASASLWLRVSEPRLAVKAPPGDPGYQEVVRQPQPPERLSPGDGD